MSKAKGGELPDGELPKWGGYEIIMQRDVTPEEADRLIDALTEAGVLRKVTKRGPIRSFLARLADSVRGRK